jgi:hypothetical protein
VDEEGDRILGNSKEWRGSDVMTQKGCFDGMPRSGPRVVSLCSSFISQPLTLIFVGAVLCVLQAMAAINPRQAEHLKKLQPQFRFKDRRIGSPSTATPPIALTTDPLLPTDLASQSSECVKLHDCYAISISSMQTSHLIAAIIFSCSRRLVP